MTTDHPHVELGAHSLPVYPQPFKRIVKRIGHLVEALQGSVDESGEFDSARFVEGIGGRLYGALTTFIPNLPEWLPEHEFNGYTSPQAWKEDRYDEDNDPSPTLPQFITAFDTIVEVNGGKRLIDGLGKVFDPKMLRAEASLALSEWRERSLTGLPTSPGASAESATSGSSQTTPTEQPQDSGSGTESLDFVPGPWVTA